ncbi:hypothetical protein F5Y15DRAFT_78190 [Xylariaceae sp. FL0016]|nr:hypothetical protein F5Y15DRAFT_78190 [Xylariaceae sp. FL0016]
MTKACLCAGTWIVHLRAYSQCCLSLSPSHVRLDTHKELVPYICVSHISSSRTGTRSEPPGSCHLIISMSSFRAVLKHYKISRVSNNMT